MVLTNCQICHKAFNCTGGKPICPECRQKEEDDFLKVREYVKDHPKVSIESVAEETRVSTETIRRYLQEGLLEQASLTDKDLKCQLCKQTITSGNYCLSCMDKLKQHCNPKKEETKEKQNLKSLTLEIRDKK
jgi:predicted amidophosphoribosyltransferase